MSESQKNPNKIGKAYEAAKSSSIGIELALCIVIGLALGHWLDGQFGTAPYLSIAMMLCGIIAGFRALIRVTRETQARLSEEAAAESAAALEASHGR